VTDEGTNKHFVVGRKGSSLSKKVKMSSMKKKKNARQAGNAGLETRGRLLRRRPRKTLDYTNAGDKEVRQARST